MFSTGAFAIKSRTPKSGCSFSLLSCWPGAETLIPVFCNRDSNFFRGFKNTAIDGFSCPTKKAQVTNFDLFIRMLGGRLGKAKYIGHTVRCDDLNGDIPSVLKNVPTESGHTN